MTQSTDTFIKSLDRSIRENPVQAGLIGLGVLWMFAGRLPLSALRDGAVKGMQATSEVGAVVVGKVGEGVIGASSALSAASDSVDSSAKGVVQHTVSASNRAAEKTMLISGDASRQIAAVFESQPLVLGLVGLAIGAGVAATIPNTDSENQLFGQHADSLKTTLAEAVSSQKEQLITSLEAMADEADTQSISKDKLVDLTAYAKETIVGAVSASTSR
jgi:hypothetical protein